MYCYNMYCYSVCITMDIYITNWVVLELSGDGNDLTSREIFEIMMNGSY